MHVSCSLLSCLCSRYDHWSAASHRQLSSGGLKSSPQIFNCMGTGAPNPLLFSGTPCSNGDALAKLIQCKPPRLGGLWAFFSDSFPCLLLDLLLLGFRENNKTKQMPPPSGINI